jgi:hypothetical protein
MKAKILTFTVLLLGGLLFTSCQKDNALLEDTATDQTIMKDNYEGYHDANEFKIEFRNFPEPFVNLTTIQYYVSRTSFVELNVYAKDSKKKMMLTRAYQRQGVYKVVFNSSHLPSGDYIAELNINGTVYTITMHKSDNVDFNYPDIN